MRNSSAPLSENIIGPFSGVPFSDIRCLVDFIIDVDREHAMGVEALDVVLVDHERWARGLGVDKPFPVSEAIWHATCEWDL